MYVVEDYLANILVPREREVQVNYFVESDYVSNTITRRSQTSLIIYCKSVLVQ